MDNKIVTYKEWKFEVDEESTKRTYTQNPLGGADGCECKDCKNFVNNRDIVYPDEIRELFVKLGIDYKKESEVCHYARLEDRLHFYGGWFHFKGGILRGQDCRVFHSETTNTFELQKVTDNFSIGFTLGNSPALFESLEGLVQIEFEAKIPWTINEEESE